MWACVCVHARVCVRVLDRLVFAGSSCVRVFDCARVLFCAYTCTFRYRFVQDYACFLVLFVCVLSRVVCVRVHVVPLYWWKCFHTPFLYI